MLFSEFRRCYGFRRFYQIFFCLRNFVLWICSQFLSMCLWGVVPNPLFLGSEVSVKMSDENGLPSSSSPPSVMLMCPPPISLSFLTAFPAVLLTSKNIYAILVLLIGERCGGRWLLRPSAMSIVRVSTYDAGNWDDMGRREPKSRCRRHVYARKDSIDGPLEIISPTESLWYKMYVENFLLLEDQHLQKKFRQRFRLPFVSFL